MSHEDNIREPDVKPIQSPTGLDLHPQPERTVRISKRAGGIIGVVILGLLALFAYGGYRRTIQAEATARDAGMLKNVAPATSASNEFIRNIPPGTAPLAGKSASELPPPANPNDTTAARHACGSDAKTGQAYRFDPQTGRPCETLMPLDRVVVRNAPSKAPPAPVQPPRPEPTPEEKRLMASYQLEQEAILAPTSVRSRSAFSSGLGGGNVGWPGARSTPANDIAQVAALTQALAGARRGPDSGNATVSQASLLSQQNGDDYDMQNMQTRKQAFLDGAHSKNDNYLASTRTAPLSTYEIKAGWEIPALLEQALNSDLPGELKALVTSNVYDTATGQYILIPQGSRLLGMYDSRVAYGQDGVQVAWSRIIFPDASAIDLDGMVGLDAQGNAGLRSKVDRHYKRLLGFAALTSLFTAAFEVSQRRNQSILVNPSAGQTTSAAVGRELSQTGAMMTRRNLNVQPTIKVPAGYRFTVRVNRDMLFEAPYEPLHADPQPIPPQQELRKRAIVGIRPWPSH